MNTKPNWFTEQDVQYTKKLFSYSKQVAELYVIKYVKMMNEIHYTDFTPDEYKKACYV